MYWWQKSSVGDSPSLSLSFSDDDIRSYSSDFRRAWSFKSDRRFISCAKKLRSRSVSETFKSSDVVNSLRNLPRWRSDEYSMAPQPLPLPDQLPTPRQEAAHPSNSTASVRLPSPRGFREEREKSDGHRRDGHASGDAMNLISGISR